MLNKDYFIDAAERNAYWKVKDKILTKLYDNKIVWLKPYKETLAYNFFSSEKKFYSYFNQMLLDEGGIYATFNQIQSLNTKLDSLCKKSPVHVRKGERSQTVMFFLNSYKNNCDKDSKEYNIVEKEIKKNPIDYKIINNLLKENKIKQIQVFKTYDVFNINQIEGLTQVYIDQKMEEYKKHNNLSLRRDLNLSQEEKGDLLIQAFKAENPHVKFTNLGLGSPFYAGYEKEIRLPLKEQVTSLSEYYSTAFHELSHATKDIIKRDDKNGSHHREKEELVAEISSCIAMTYLDINTPITDKNSLAYCQSWASAIEKLTPREIVWSFGQATKASSYLIDLYTKSLTKEQNKNLTDEIKKEYLPNK